MLTTLFLRRVSFDVFQCVVGCSCSSCEYCPPILDWQPSFSCNVSRNSVFPSLLFSSVFPFPLLPPPTPLPSSLSLPPSSFLSPSSPSLPPYLSVWISLALSLLPLSIWWWVVVEQGVLYLSFSLSVVQCDDLLDFVVEVSVYIMFALR